MTLDTSIYEHKERAIVKIPELYIIVHVIPFARHSIADVHDPMAIQFMIMNL